MMVDIFFHVLYDLCILLYAIRTDNEFHLPTDFRVIENLYQTRITLDNCLIYA